MISEREFFPLDEPQYPTHPSDGNLRLHSGGHSGGRAFAISRSEERHQLATIRKRPVLRRTWQRGERGQFRFPGDGDGWFVQSRTLVGAETGKVFGDDSRVLPADEGSDSIRPAPVGERADTGSRESGPGVEADEDLCRGGVHHTKIGRASC